MPQPVRLTRFLMFHIPDTETLRLCRVLSSAAFAFVFAFVRFGRRGERYCLHWSASALLYAAVLIGFEYAPGHPYFKSMLLGLLAATNMLIISGLRAFDDKPPFRWWMLLPIAGCAATHLIPTMIAAGHPCALLTQVGDTLSIAVSALLTGIACLSGERRDTSRTDQPHTMSRGRRLGYLPGYAITLIGYLWTAPVINLLALIPRCSPINSCLACSISACLRCPLSVRIGDCAIR